MQELWPPLWRYDSGAKIQDMQKDITKLLPVLSRSDLIIQELLQSREAQRAQVVLGCQQKWNQLRNESDGQIYSSKSPIKRKSFFLSCSVTCIEDSSWLTSFT